MASVKGQIFQHILSWLDMYFFKFSVWNSPDLISKDYRETRKREAKRVETRKLNATLEGFF